MRLLIWDFDGTLGYRQGAWSGALLDVLKAKALASQISQEEISAHLHSGFPWHVPDEVREATSAEAWWGNLEPVFSKAFIGVGIDQNVAAQLATEVRAAYLEPSNFRLYPDSLLALEKLTRHGWKHVLLTNHVPELNLILEYLGLQKSFVKVFNSAETGVEKPHARAFLNVLDALNPETAWMIGDNPVADIAGAEAVNLPAILVRNKDTKAKHVYAGLDEVKVFLT